MKQNNESHIVKRNVRRSISIGQFKVNGLQGSFHMGPSSTVLGVFDALLKTEDEVTGHITN